MKQWEYKIVTLASMSEEGESKYLSDLGKQGWEMLQVFEVNKILYKYIFKRKLS